MAIPTKKAVNFILFFGLIIHSYCQETTDISYYNVFDQIVGVENTEVYQGVLYNTQYRINNDKNEFFKNQDFTKGSIVYSGQPYHDLDIKYDIHKDRVFTKLAANAGGGTLILFNDILQSFEIGDNLFVKIDSTRAFEIETYGFYKVSSENSLLTLLTKYSKREVRRVDKKTVYREFLDKPNSYIVLYKNKYYNMNSKKDAKKLFPKLNTEIDKFYSNVRRLRKSNPEGFQIALVKRIEILISRQGGE